MSESIEYTDKTLCQVFFVSEIDKNGLVFIPDDFNNDEISEALKDILLIQKCFNEGIYEFQNRFLSKLDMFYISNKKSFYVNLSNV
jgi:hypothetical protein